MTLVQLSATPVHSPVHRPPRRWRSPGGIRPSRHPFAYRRPRPNVPHDALAKAVSRFRADPLTEEPALLGLRLVAAHRLREALEVTELALHREPDDEDVLVVHARILCELSDYGAARESLAEAIRLAPDWREPLILLTRVWLAIRADSSGADAGPAGCLPIFPSARQPVERAGSASAARLASPAELYPGCGLTRTSRDAASYRERPPGPRRLNLERRM